MPQPPQLPAPPPPSRPPSRSISGFDEWTPAHTEGLKGLGSALLGDYQRGMNWLGTNVGENPLMDLAAFYFLARPSGKQGRYLDTTKRLGSLIGVDTGELAKEDQLGRNLVDAVKYLRKRYPAALAQVEAIGVKKLPDTRRGEMVHYSGETTPGIVVNKSLLSDPHTLVNTLAHELQHVAQNYWGYIRGRPSTFVTNLEAEKAGASNVTPYLEQPEEIAARVRALKDAFQRNNVISMVSAWKQIPKTVQGAIRSNPAPYGLSGFMNYVNKLAEQRGPSGQENR